MERPPDCLVQAAPGQHGMSDVDHHAGEPAGGDVVPFEYFGDALERFERVLHSEPQHGTEAGGSPPAASDAASASTSAAQRAHILELQARLESRLAAAPPADAEFCIDLVVAQASEIWNLRRQLRRAKLAASSAKALAGCQGCRTLGAQKSELRAAAEEALRLKRLEFAEAEMCTELVEEAKRVSDQAWELQKRDRVREDRLASLRGAERSLDQLRGQYDQLEHRAEQLQRGDDQLQRQAEHLLLAERAEARLQVEFHGSERSGQLLRDQVDRLQRQADQLPGAERSRERLQLELQHAQGLENNLRSQLAQLQRRADSLSFAERSEERLYLQLRQAERGEEEVSGQLEQEFLHQRDRETYYYGLRAEIQLETQDFRTVLSELREELAESSTNNVQQHQPIWQPQPPRQAPSTDAGRLFDMFAGRGARGLRRMRPAEFAQMCETLRRDRFLQQGQKPAPFAQGFGEWAFFATFGASETEVGREQFTLLFPYARDGMEELENQFLKGERNPYE